MPSGPKAVLTALCLGLLHSASAVAETGFANQKMQVLGRAWLASNDAIGDGKDRWRSVGFRLSTLVGREWDGQLPARFGEMLEFRYQGEVLAPSNLVTPDPADRQYAGILSFGLHSHFALGRSEARVGADLVAVGPQTGVADLHEGVHDAFGLSAIHPNAQELGNGVFPTLSAEYAVPLRLGRHVSLRPFVGARAGDETLVRIGADLSFGAYDRYALWLRDTGTGHRFVGVRGPDDPRGLYGIVGADLAAIADSAWLPDDGAAVAKEYRARLRGGGGFSAERWDGFFGLTWLSQEYQGQDEGQVVGSVTVRLRF